MIGNLFSRCIIIYTYTNGKKITPKKTPPIPPPKNPPSIECRYIIATITLYNIQYIRDYAQENCLFDQYYTFPLFSVFPPIFFFFLLAYDDEKGKYTQINMINNKNVCMCSEEIHSNLNFFFQIFFFRLRKCRVCIWFLLR